MFRKKDKKEKSKILNKAYRFKIYPNEKQKIQINKTFGCVRFVYNYFLNERKNVYKYTGTSMSLTDCNNDCNKLKKEEEYSFLKEVDKFALTNALTDLNTAYTNFFREIIKGNKNWGYPKFKSKRN
jgi:putative transposase